jgi:c-di-GMP-binding flagellar brake protein YcgR
MGIFKMFFGRRVGQRKPRLGFRVPIEESARMHRAKDGTSHSVIVVDLSQGGACIATPLKLAPNERLGLSISAGKSPFEFGCQVVTVRERPGRLHFDYGVKFVAVKPGEIDRLRSFIAYRDDARKSRLGAFSNVRTHQ